MSGALNGRLVSTIGWQKRPAHPHVCSIRAADLFREFFQVVALRLALDLADRILEGSIPEDDIVPGHGGVSGRALAKRAVGHLEPPNIDKRGGGIDFIPAENDTHPPQSAVGHQDDTIGRQGIQFCHKAVHIRLELLIHELSHHELRLLLLQVTPQIHGEDLLEKIPKIGQKWTRP